MFANCVLHVFDFLSSSVTTYCIFQFYRLQTNAAMRHKLRAYAEMDLQSLVVLLAHPFSVEGRKVYKRLHLQPGSTLRALLDGCVLVEYPSITVLLPTYDQSRYPILNDVREAVPIMALVPEAEPSEDESSSSSSSSEDEDSDSSSGSSSSEEVDSESSSSSSSDEAAPVKPCAVPANE